MSGNTPTPVLIARERSRVEVFAPLTTIPLAVGGSALGPRRFLFFLALYMFLFHAAASYVSVPQAPLLTQMPSFATTVL